jgi:hypothetical protein
MQDVQAIVDILSVLETGWGFIISEDGIIMPTTEVQSSQPEEDWIQTVLGIEHKEMDTLLQQLKRASSLVGKSYTAISGIHGLMEPPSNTCKY